MPKGTLWEYTPVIVALHCLAKKIAISKPRNEFRDPSNGTRIFLIDVCFTKPFELAI